MTTVASKVMFEIYRQSDEGPFRVVYFTELEEHNKEAEIARAMAGTHVYDGFLAEMSIKEAKAAVQSLLDRLNDGQPVGEEVIAVELSAYEA